MIFLAAEGDADEIHRRLLNVCVLLGVGLEELGDLHIWPLADSDPALVRASRDDTLAPTPLWAALEVAVDTIKPVAVFLDSRADVFAGDEISRNQARGFVGMLRPIDPQPARRGAAISPQPVGHGVRQRFEQFDALAQCGPLGALLTRPSDPDTSDPDGRTLTVVKSNWPDRLDP